MQYKFFFSYLRIHWSRLLFALVLVVLLVNNLVWMAIGVFVFKGTHKVILHYVGTIRRNIFQKMLKSVFLILYVFAVGISIKLLVVDIYQIPSSSMENTLFPKDVILVNKLVYGPKLPQSPFDIPWVNLLFYLTKSKGEAVVNPWPYTRLSGSGKVLKGNVLVFQTSKTFFLVKRCMGTAGDTLSIRKGEVFVNGKKYKEPLTVKNRYGLKVNNQLDFYRQKDSMGIRAKLFPDKKKSSKNFIGILSHSEKNKLKSLSSIKTIDKVLDTFNKSVHLFSNTDLLWTLDYMGPFRVPKKDMVVELNPFTVELYKTTLQEHEQVELIQMDGNYYIDGKKVNQYTFTKDYYFMMGDNRKESMDSRFIGFVPEEAIVGKVQCVLFSNNQEKFRWNRVLKKVD